MQRENALRQRLLEKKGGAGGSSTAGGRSNPVLPHTPSAGAAHTVVGISPAAVASACDAGCGGHGMAAMASALDGVGGGGSHAAQSLQRSTR